MLGQDQKCETAHLADMISENWLILCASDLPLEPRLRLPVVGNLQCSCTIANLWQVRHGVSDSDGSVDSAITSVEDRTFSLAYNHDPFKELYRFCDQEIQINNLVQEVRFTLPCNITDVFLFVHHHTQRASSGSKHMQRLRITRQLLSRSSSQDDCPAARLGNTVLASLMRRASLSMLVD